MLLRKHQYIALVSGSLSVLALVNCSDNDTPIGGSSGSSGSSGAGKAGASEPGAGAGGKVASGGKGGANSHAGEPSETAGGTSEAGGAGKPGAGAGGAANPGGSGNMSDAGEGGMADDGGAAGEGPTGPHVNAILKYNFDEGAGLVAVDNSGSGLNGTLALATSWTAQGRNGAGLALSGGVMPTTYVTVPPGIFKGVKSTTIATWVKLGVLGVGWNRIFDFSNAGADTATRFMFLSPNANDGIHFSTFGGTQAREAIIATGTQLPTSVWKHVAVTIADGGKRSIYIDGFPAAETTTIDVSPSELEPLSASSWLGKSRFDNDSGLNAAMDEFAVYDRVLAPAEIATLAAPKNDYTRIPFDEGTGTTSIDTSTRAVNATLTDATWASGRLGAAVQLSGATQFVTLNNPLAGCTDSLTVAMWVKEIALAPWTRLFDFGGTSDNFMFLTPNGDAGKMQLSIHITGTETVVLSPTTLPADSTWHHVAVVINPAAANIYVDGVLGGSTPTPVTPAVLGATNEHWLGKSRFSATDAYFNGAFDEVRISCRAYTADEIKNLAFH